MSTVLSAPDSAVVTSTASPAAPAAPAVPASPADGSVPASPAGSPESPNIRQLREQYEATKRSLEPWERLNAKPEDVATHYPIVQKMRTEASELGQKLGYNADEVQQEFLKDPVNVLAYLRQQAQLRDSKPPSGEDLRREMQRIAEESLKPIISREDTRMNNEAQFRFNGEFDRLFNAKYKDGLPDEVRTDIYEMVGQMVGEDPEAIKRLKFQGQVSDIAKAFESATARYFKSYAALSAHERKRTGQSELPTGNAGEKSKSKMDIKLSTGQTVKELWS